MTRPLNLDALSDAAGVLDEELFCKYESVMSSRENKLKYDPVELESLRSLVSSLYSATLDSYDLLEGFAYSYSIPRIASEFDLLKISDEMTLDIELKSDSPGVEKIKKQLKRNRHFLKHLSPTVMSYTYVASENAIYKLTEGGLVKTSVDDLIDAMSQFGSFYSGDFDLKFKPSDYLISPLFDTESFLQGAYFLNNQQERYKKSIVEDMNKEAGFFACVVTGLPGTGKSLLLYDIALEYAKTEGRPICMIHCGRLQDVHIRFNCKQKWIRIINPSDYKSISRTDYSAVFFDEMQRLYSLQFDPIFDLIEANDLPCVMSLDRRQYLSKFERQNDFLSDLENRFGAIDVYELNTKVRTNPEIRQFIKGFFDTSKAHRGILNGKVKIYYAGNKAQAKRIVVGLQGRGCQFIRLSNSAYTTSELDFWQIKGARSTHDVVGLEYDKVVMAIGDFAWYKPDTDTKLHTKIHPYDDYLYTKLLFQGMTRAREELAIVVYNNQPLFTTLLDTFF